MPYFNVPGAEMAVSVDMTLTTWKNVLMLSVFKYRNNVKSYI